MSEKTFEQKVAWYLEPKRFLLFWLAAVLGAVSGYILIQIQIGSVV